jgi:hypothetical protein
MREDWDSFSQSKETEDRNLHPQTSWCSASRALIPARISFHLPFIHDIVSGAGGWWTDESRDVIKARRRALRYFKGHPTLENSIYFKLLRDESQCVILEAKRTSRKAFVSSLSRSTHVRELHPHLCRLPSHDRQALPIYSPFFVLNPHFRHSYYFYLDTTIC